MLDQSSLGIQGGVRLGAEPAWVMVTTLAGRFRGVSRAERKAAVGWTRVAWRGGAPQARKLGKSQGRGCASNGGPSEGASSRSSPYPPTLARDRWSLPGRQYMSWTRVRYVRNPSQSFHVRKRALYAPGASELSAGSPCSLCRAALRPAYPNKVSPFRDTCTRTFVLERFQIFAKSSTIRSFVPRYRCHAAVPST